MRREQIAVGALFLALAVAAAQAQGGGGGGQGGGARGGAPAPPPMRMTTTSFEDGGILPAKVVGAMGVSPALSWTNVPMGTQSFVLLLHDPDVAQQRSTRDVTHWLVWNIPGTAIG